MAVGTTRGKRKLGRLVQSYMDHSGVKVEDLAREVRTSRHTVNRLLSGEHRARWATFLAILGVLKITEAEREEAKALWEVADDEPVKIEHAADLPNKYLRYRRDEGEASLVRTLDPAAVPGLLQTPRYADAMAEAAWRLIKRESWKTIAADERRDRQALLRREPRPLELHALVDEAALNRLVGGVEVMREQYDYLLEIGSLANVTIQIIPCSAGAYATLAGPLILLRFPEPNEPESAYIESVTGIAPVDDQNQVSALSAVWDDVARMALSAEESADLIRAKRDGRNHDSKDLADE